MAPQLLWIGLGNMGRGMCLNLVQKGSLGKPHLIYNRTQKRCDEFVTQVGSANAKTCTSLKEGVGSSDIIFSCLSSDSAVENIYESMVKEGDVRGKLFVECSTISPELVDKIAKLMIDHGAEFHAPYTYLKMAMEKSPGDQVDVSAIYGAVRKANGLEFENTP
ncbi:6-phosphogluconate dehydrogenase 2 [Fusarium subglutinans]|uniref:6-phosphogluconate dehydrogenase 2 n=1 Tax=Gibberella subglutinans TaxID=42677 RepID=A0A8H5L8E3_GIBSU|nr:6-phosphogluconate dehydrogenase 2 [Fusarium subglutinans]KAF5586888.1 6-phosphogluconate dehydrogenase 2 [Fusarium subglutinans]